jgi:hypothetical protein
VFAAVLEGSNALDLVRVTLALALKIGCDIFTSLDNITVDVEGVAGSFRDGQTIVQGKAGRNSTEADDDTPHLVDSEIADTRALADAGGSLERAPETSGDDEGNESTGQLTNTLHSEHGSHHGTTPLGGGESAMVSLDLNIQGKSTYSEVMMEDSG